MVGPPTIDEEVLVSEVEVENLTLKQRCRMARCTCQRLQLFETWVLSSVVKVT